MVRINHSFRADNIEYDLFAKGLWLTEYPISQGPLIQ